MEDDVSFGGDVLPVNLLQTIARQHGYKEQQRLKESLVFSRPSGHQSSLFPTVIEIYLNSGDVVTYLPHPRQRAYRLFHFGAASSPDSIAEVFRRPWNDLQFAYRMSDIVAQPGDAIPTAPPPTTFTNALERQLAVIEREIADLKAEKAELRRKLRSHLRSRGDSLLDESDYNSSLRGGEADSDAAFMLAKEVASGTRELRALQRNLVSARQYTPDGHRATIDAAAAKGVSGERGTRRHLSSVDDFSGRASSSRARDRLCNGPIGDEDVVGGGGVGADLSQSTVSGSKLITSSNNNNNNNNNTFCTTTTDRVRGNKAVWNLYYPDAQEEFGKTWASKPVSLIALGRGYVVAYDDGSAAWNDICPLLESKLRQQGLNPASSSSNGPKGGNHPVRIKYLVLGSESNFYVKFDNGRMEWCGQDGFGETLRRGVNERRLLVDRVAFGQHGGWIVLWSDGSYDCEGLPSTLIDRLKRSGRHHSHNNHNNNNNNNNRGDGTPQSPPRDGRIISGMASGIKDVTVGPTGEWFVIYKDHSVQADNLPDALYKTLSQIREKSGRVRSIIFGENRSWFVRYWDGHK